MRTCGGCTLCCKLPRIPAIDKPSNEWCRLCTRGVGCNIYEARPQPCREFRCLWLASDMPDEMRPDRASLYVSGKAGDDLLKILVDTDHPQAWQDGIGKEVVEYVLTKAHALIVVGRQLTFVPGKDRVLPEKLQIDWLL